MLPLVRCHNIHFTIPVDIVVGHQGKKYLQRKHAQLFRLDSYRKYLLCFDLTFKLMKFQFTSIVKRCDRVGWGCKKAHLRVALIRNSWLASCAYRLHVFVYLQADLCFGLSAYNKIVNLARSCVVCFQFGVIYI